MRFDYWRDPQLTAGIVVLVLLAGVCGGAYPALVLAALQPARVLKEARVQRSDSGRTRALLVGAQFCILIVLIVCAAVVLLADQLFDDRGTALRQGPGAVRAQRVQHRRLQGPGGGRCPAYVASHVRRRTP